jgi:glycosyltransferase involved in cell wall biosynthesis
MKLSLVIPCYNEEKNLPLLAERCTSLLARTDAEVILVDNGSTDGSAVVLAELQKKFPTLRTIKVEKNQGYGFGIVSGLKAATGDVLCWTHADMQTDPEDALTGFGLFQKSASPETLFVKGRRYGRPFADVFFTVGMSVFETLLLGKPLWDINAQPTMFHRSFFSGWKEPPDDFALDLYAYFLARKQGLHVARFPVAFGKRAHGISHWNINWRAKIKFIKRTAQYSLRLKRKAVM